MRFQRNWIYYGRLVSEVLIGQAHHDLGPDTLFAAALEPVTQRSSPPVLPAGVKGHRRAMMLWRVAPPQAIAVAENTAV